MLPGLLSVATPMVQSNLNLSFALCSITVVLVTVSDWTKWTGERRGQYAGHMRTSKCERAHFHVRLWWLMTLERELKRTHRQRSSELENIRNEARRAPTSSTSPSCAPMRRLWAAFAVQSPASCTTETEMKRESALMKSCYRLVNGNICGVANWPTAPGNLFEFYIKLNTSSTLYIMHHTRI